MKSARHSVDHDIYECETIRLELKAHEYCYTIAISLRGCGYSHLTDLHQHFF